MGIPQRKHLTRRLVVRFGGPCPLVSESGMHQSSRDPATAHQQMSETLYHFNRRISLAVTDLMSPVICEIIVTQ